ncbi:MAG: N-acetylmuramic acid 6-phosphate etherase [Bacteroidales bacterium]|nr:N-acetylmuramic acid 6-phosphate etherase [Bacteroidales bacterium]
MSLNKVTEQSSNYAHLDKMTTEELLMGMNKEDQSVPVAVGKCIPQITKFVDGLVERMKKGGRLFYLGAGTSGRLGILDASEIPPTYGAPYDLVIGLIAGGDTAIRKAVENAEDDYDMGWKDLEKFNIGGYDSVVGIAASGSTPYVVGACAKAREKGLLTACITCNPGAKVAEVVEIPIVAVVGPEFVTGSTRMKSGTAQKLILNMISTSAMIKLGHVKGNKMVDMQLSNKKLVDRGTRMIMDETGITDYEKAKEYLLKYGSVRNGVDAYKAGK